MSIMTKEEHVYNQSIGDMGMYLVMNKILPSELALVHYDIVLNIEVVNMNDEQDVFRAKQLLVDAYDKLKHHWKFKNKIKFIDGKIQLLEG